MNMDKTCWSKEYAHHDFWLKLATANHWFCMFTFTNSCGIILLATNLYIKNHDSSPVTTSHNGHLPSRNIFKFSRQSSTRFLGFSSVNSWGTQRATTLRSFRCSCIILYIVPRERECKGFNFVISWMRVFHDNFTNGFNVALSNPCNWAIWNGAVLIL